MDQCVFNEFKNQCVTGKSVLPQSCVAADPKTINGCSVEGYYMDCYNFDMWTCGNITVLPGENVKDPPAP